MRANYINEGATLIISTESNRLGIEVTEDNQDLLIALFQLINKDAE